MGYRQVIVKKCEKMKFKDNQLTIVKEEGEYKVPLEDISFILIEDQTTVITTRLLAELGRNAVALIVCDDTYQPVSIMYPYNHHFKQLTVLQKQMNQLEGMKNELWKIIVKQKIRNQISVLEMKIKDERVINRLYEYEEEVSADDITNREGLSAKMYFRSLFGSTFIRFYDDAINNALNYGYTIVMSCVIRNLSVFGLHSFLGIHHQSKTNTFNLACDLMEPYRPLVDVFVFDHISEITEQLSFPFRQKLVNIMNHEVLVEGKRCTVEYGIELLIKSYVKTFETGEVGLQLPAMIYV